MTNGFTAAPFSSAAAGQTTTLFITGEGQVSPSLATGTSPVCRNSADAAAEAQLPVTVTVAGQTATIEFIGIPSGFGGSDADQLPGSRQYAGRRAARGGDGGRRGQPGGEF